MGAELTQDLIGDTQGVIVALGFLCAVAAATVSWEIATVAVLAMSLGETHLGFDFGFRALDYTVSPFDVLSIALSVAALFRMLIAGRITRVQILWLVILGYAFLRFIGGMGDFGLQSAVSFYRQSFYVSSALFYSLTIDWTLARLDRLVKMWILVGTALAILGLLEWFPGGVIPRPANWRVKILYAFDQVRVLPASTALIIAQAGLIGLAVWSQNRSSVLMRTLSIFLLAMSFGLFHRSVWVASLAGTATLLAFSRDSLTRVAPFLLLGAAGTMVLWMLQQGMGVNLLTDAVQSAVQEPFSQESSLAWRITGWELLLERAFSSGWGQMIFGAGYGAGYERQIGWSTVLYSPHNFYVATLLDTGLVGAGLWIYGFFRIGAGLLGEAPAGFAVWRPCLMTLLVTIVVYNIPYSQPTEQGLWLGVLAGVAVLFGRSAAPAPATARLS